MNEEIYYVSEREDIKTKIIKDLEKRLIENKEQTKPIDLGQIY